MGAKQDLTGQRFGRLTVIEEDGRKNGGIAWRCRCDCGNYTTVRANHLKRGLIKSCGCYNQDIITRHGMSHTRLHSVWSCMIDRCTNPNAQEADRYYNRGIRVCDEWLVFENFRDWALANGFVDDVKRGVCTLDRIDNDGNYEPSNCRWATAKQQARNRSNNVVIEMNGERHCLAEWAELLGEPAAKLRSRYRRGWSDRQVLFGR